MKEKVAAFIKENSLIAPGSSVLAAVSGGADSVALLCILARLREELDCTLYAAHLNHGIRGAAADADEAYVEELCQRLGVPLTCLKLDIPGLAREHGHTLEQEGRIARYDFLERTRAGVGAQCVAVAHHMDDEAESVLMHLMRGSGLAGLTGIKARRGNIIRPLLCVRRAEIEEYLHSLGVAYCTDETNLIREGTRNRIRLDVVPYVEKYINPAFTQALCSMAELVSRDEEYLAKTARDALEAASRDGGFEREALAALPMPILTRAIRIALADIGAVVDIERSHVEKAAGMIASGRTGAMMDMHCALMRISYGLVYFERPDEKRGASFEAFEIPFAVEGETRTPEGVFCAHITDDLTVGADPYTAYMDFAAVPEALTVRRRLPGDRFRPLGAPGERKLKEYFIDRKLPREARETPLVASGGTVLFVPGCGIADSVKVKANTARVLRVKYTKNSNP